MSWYRTSTVMAPDGDSLREVLATHDSLSASADWSYRPKTVEDWQSLRRRRAKNASTQDSHHRAEAINRQIVETERDEKIAATRRLMSASRQSRNEREARARMARARPDTCEELMQKLARHRVGCPYCSGSFILARCGTAENLKLMIGRSAVPA